MKINALLQQGDWSWPFPGKMVPVLLVLILIFPFFFWGGPGYHAARSFKALWDLGHILFFALATFLVLHLARQRGLDTKWRFVLALIILGTVGGILIELLQLGAGNRSVDPWDVYRDFLGILTGLIFCQTLPAVGRLRWCFFIVYAILFSIALRPLAVALVDECLAERQFPILADFETFFEQDRFQPNNRLKRTDNHARSGGHSLRVQLTTDTYSGVSLFYFPHTWEGYDQLHFSVYNPGREELQLHCRVHDRWHKEHGQRYEDRFNQSLRLYPGWNDYTISLLSVRQSPSGREMDMNAIESFALFVVRQDRSRVLYLDHIFLSR